MKKIHLGGKYGSVIGNYALVDDKDYEWLNKHKWTAKKSGNTFYAERGYWVEYGKLRCVKMHREILGLELVNDVADHINRNGLDNQRHNIRKCTRQENTMNRVGNYNSTSKYKGVHYDKESKKWRSCIRVDGVLKNIGRFDNQEAAAKAYNAHARQVHGEFARLNNI